MYPSSPFCPALFSTNQKYGKSSVMRIACSTYQRLRRYWLVLTNHLTAFQEERVQATTREPILGDKERRAR